MEYQECDMSMICKMVVKNAYSLLPRHSSQIELFYWDDIGRGLKISHGVNTVIEAHCKIGDNSIIGADSVVTKSCSLNSILVGTPAKIVGINE